MKTHGRRIGYNVAGEGRVLEPQDWLGGAAEVAADGGAAAAATQPEVPALKFGRMFGRTRHETPPGRRKEVIDKLVRLGLCMNGDKNAGCPPLVVDGPDVTDIPAGYTYLGQFIAHEITFDSTGSLLIDGAPEGVNNRTPQIDLDSLYGKGPAANPQLFESDGVSLRVGETTSVPKLNRPFTNDLPRVTSGEKAGEAIVGDERNDENLILAQTHLAFIKFHNKVVERLRAEGAPAGELFERARAEVSRHFQWLILNDFLPRLVRADVLDCVLRHGLRWFKVEDAGGLYMPLEFSAAAFRIGHSMVRATYELNHYHSKSFFADPVSLMELFRHTKFSGDLGGRDDVGQPFKSLPSDWVVDWRRFYDFEGIKDVPPLTRPRNSAARIDTVFALHLNEITGYPHGEIQMMQRAITVRNLLRGFYLSLPTGEEVAERIGETPLKREELAEGPLAPLVDDEDFRGKTPLWYYVLKEAELELKRNGRNRLGPVGGRIVAETLVGLIARSRYSVLSDPAWRPTFGRPATDEGPARFEMTDLLKFADEVNPIGRHLNHNDGQ